MDRQKAESDGSSDSAIDIRVPGSDRFLEVLRSVVGRAARISGFTYAGIEDFSLAVDEAAVLLLATAPDELELKLEGVVPGADRLTAVVSVRSPHGEWPVGDLERDTRWQILEALCDAVWLVDEREKGIGLSQSVR